MGNLSEHFDSAEFACKDRCGFGTNPSDVSDELVTVLENLRAHFGSPVVITSGCRCRTHNANVGGARSSQHCLGTAADIVVSRASPSEVYRFLDKAYPSKYGMGKYSRWVHIDVRRNKARWGS